ncbi:MAG: HNH endonuclease domain-containing protein [Gammaproteobacteria bacterium]
MKDLKIEETIPSYSVGMLPTSKDLNIPALSGLFRHTTNSYKYIFFLSILELLKDRNFSVKEPFSFHDLTIEMLVTAWFPHTFFKLSFGTQDTLTNKLDQLELDFSNASSINTTPNRNLLRSVIGKKNLEKAIRLMDFVPYRLLIPFLEDKLKSVDKGAWMKLEYAMPEIANTNFNIEKPLYRFDSKSYKNCSSLFIHPEWAIYLEKHFSIIFGWAAWNWLFFMQKKNPATPGLSNKLFIPQRRDSLNTQKKYWREILKNNKDIEFKCIYSGFRLKPEQFSLDHYLPWSFVVHDQLWILVPTLPSINSAKSNKIPSNRYFNQFVEFQHRGLLIAKEKFSTKRFEKFTESYISDLI